MGNIYPRSRSYSFKRLLVVLASINAAWIVAYVGYIVVLPLLGVQLSYMETPLLSAAYYLAWVAIMLYFFPHFFTQIHLAQKRGAFVLLAGCVSVIALFYAALLPSLVGYGAIDAESGNFFLRATPDFFFPKMVELLFQQLVITALVLAIASFDNNIFFVSMVYMLVFAIGHAFVLLETPVSYVLIYVVGALLSACIFPYLILRVENGFVYSFLLHWAYYLGLTIIFLA